MASNKNTFATYNKKKATTFLLAATNLPNYTSQKTHQQTQFLAPMAYQKINIENQHSTHELDTLLDSSAA